MPVRRVFYRYVAVPTSGGGGRAFLLVSLARLPREDCMVHLQYMFGVLHEPELLIPMFFWSFSVISTSFSFYVICSFLQCTHAYSLANDIITTEDGLKELRMSGTAKKLESSFLKPLLHLLPLFSSRTLLYKCIYAEAEAVSTRHASFLQSVID